MILLFGITVGLNTFLSFALLSVLLPVFVLSPLDGTVFPLFPAFEAPPVFGELTGLVAPLLLPLFVFGIGAGWWWWCDGWLNAPDAASVINVINNIIKNTVVPITCGLYLLGINELYFV